MKRIWMNRVTAAGAVLIAMLLTVAATGATAPPDNPGMHMLKTENYSGAKAYFETALKKNPKDAATTADMAKLYLAESKNDAGVDWAKKTVALAPRDASYQLLLGFAYSRYINDVSIFHKLGVVHKIRAAFEEAVQLDPTDADAHSDLFGYYANAPSVVGGSTEKAKQQIALLQKLDPITAKEDMAALAEINKNDKQAEADLRDAAKLDHSGNAVNQLGALLASQKQYAAAIAAFSDGIKEAPSNSANYYQLGRMAVLSKTHVQEGIDALEKYLGMPHDWQPGGPGYKWAHYRLGMLYGIAGDKAKQKAEYEAATSIDPDFKQARKALASM